MRYEFADVERTAIRSLLPNEPRCAAWTTGVSSTALPGYCIRRIVSRSAGELGPLPQAQSLRSLAKQEIQDTTMSAPTVADHASCRSIRPLCACINTHNECHQMNAAVAPEPRAANTEDGCIAIPGNVSTAAVAALLRQ